MIYKKIGISRCNIWWLPIILCNGRWYLINFSLSSQFLSALLCVYSNWVSIIYDYVMLPNIFLLYNLVDQPHCYWRKRKDKKYHDVSSTNVWEKIHSSISTISPNSRDKYLLPYRHQVLDTQQTSMANLSFWSKLNIKKYQKHNKYYQLNIKKQRNLQLKNKKASAYMKFTCISSKIVNVSWSKVGCMYLKTTPNAWAQVSRTGATTWSDT